MKSFKNCLGNRVDESTLLLERTLPFKFGRRLLEDSVCFILRIMRLLIINDINIVYNDATLALDPTLVNISSHAVLSDSFLFLFGSDVWVRFS